jgi:hypothetical protein
MVSVETVLFEVNAAAEETVVVNKNVFFVKYKRKLKIQLSP